MKLFVTVFLSAAVGFIGGSFIANKVIAFKQTPQAIKNQARAVETGFTAATTILVFGVFRGLLGS